MFFIKLNEHKEHRGGSLEVEVLIDNQENISRYRFFTVKVERRVLVQSPVVKILHYDSIILLPLVIIMNIDEIIKSRRSIRRFKQDPIDESILIDLVDCGRLAPSGGNSQPLEYVIVTNAEQCEKIFDSTSWAAYIAPSGTPPEGYRPVAYIIILVNTRIKEERYEFDIGAAAQNILLAAAAKGIASCWIRNLNHKELKRNLELPEHVLPDSVIALGYPAEESRIEPVVESIKYWKDQDGTMHVPKRALETILHMGQYRQTD